MTRRPTAAGTDPAHDVGTPVQMYVPQHLVPAVQALLEADGWSDLRNPRPAVVAPLPGDRWDHRAVTRLALTAAEPGVRLLDLLSKAGGAEVNLDHVAAGLGRTRMQATGTLGGLHKHVTSCYGDRPFPVNHRHDGTPPHMRYFWWIDPDFATAWLRARAQLGESASRFAAPR